MALSYPNAIWRGQAEHQPKTVTGTVAGAYSPGYFVTKSGTELTVAATAQARVFLLSNREFYTQTSTDAYESGDTGHAYRLKPEEEFRAIAAIGTYAEGDALTVNTSGQLAAAATGDVVIGYADEGKTLAAAGFLDFVVANSYVVPA